ncbi:18.6 kDa class III heat shock protein-like [Triticum dicoccoides]|uniref:18.6 kDa class III heat shock protein-like n=1 Tax=Triticum dicoccoides TaxID=85692 RepID=UPI001891993B|nr:18.6 kDa class III heat shock protein-like [Triticum dicoccoides]
MAELLFARAVAGLVHLPLVLECLTVADADHWDHAHKHAAHGHGHGHHGSMPVDIVETRGDYAFLLDVPILSKSDMQKSLEEDNVLVMKSANRKRKREEEEADCRYIRLESRASPRSFVRRFRLPEQADADTLAARCESGVLTVSLKKQQPPERNTKFVQFAIA